MSPSLPFALLAALLYAVGVMLVKRTAFSFFDVLVLRWRLAGAVLMLAAIVLVLA